MIEKKKVIEIVNKWLEGKNYFLTDLTVDENNHIVVEIDDKEGVWIDDCVDLSKYIESYLNRDEEDYELEVGSAGLGQPFKVLEGKIPKLTVFVKRIHGFQKLEKYTKIIGV